MQGERYRGGELVYEPQQPLRSGRDEASMRAPAHKRELAHKTTAELVTGIAQETRRLFELEMESAKLDFRSEMSRAKTAGVSMGTGAALAGTGAVFLLLMITFLLDLALPLWASFAIVGGVLLIAGAIMLMTARTKARHTQVPGRQAVQEATEDARWIKKSVSGAR